MIVIWGSFGIQLIIRMYHYVAILNIPYMLHKDNVVRQNYNHKLLLAIMICEYFTIMLSNFYR